MHVLFTRKSACGPKAVHVSGVNCNETCITQACQLT